jgi:hypothetical protein
MLFKEIIKIQYLKFYYNGINNKIQIHSSLLCSISIGCNFVNRFTQNDSGVSSGEEKFL